MTDWLDISDATTRISYTATSGQTVFDVPFEFFSESDLAVYINGVLKTLSTHYSTSGALEEGGGSITLVTGATAGDSVVIELALDYELTTHVPTTGQLDVAAINLQFSKFVSMIKQLAANAVRSLRQPASDTEDMADLPTAAQRASKYLAFDADGDPMASAGPSGAATSAFMATVLDDETAEDARTTLGIADQ